MKAPKSGVLLRVVKGGLTPADEASRLALRKKGFRLGDVVTAAPRKARNPGFHRKAHALGDLIREQVEGFEQLDSHAVLKRIQLEADIMCDHMQLVMPGIGPVLYRIPQSLAFDSMDESDFTRFYNGVCDHISRRYWPDLPPEAVGQMAEFMPEAA